MKQDKHSTARPTLKRWSNRSPAVKPRWARPKTEHQAPANFIESFMPESSLSLRPGRRAIKEGSKVANHDWVNNQTCSLSHNIHVVSGSFITNGYFPKLIRKIISTNKFSSLQRVVTLKNVSPHFIIVQIILFLVLLDQ